MDSTEKYQAIVKQAIDTFLYYICIVLCCMYCRVNVHTHTRPRYIPCLAELVLGGRRLCLFRGFLLPAAAPVVAVALPADVVVVAVLLVD